MSKVTYVPANRAPANQETPFQFIGDGTNGRVVGRDGRVLMESGKDIGIYAAMVGPDKTHVLIKGGDAVNFVVNANTGDRIKLPVTPPGLDMLSFGGWHWIDDHSLIGESGVRALDRDGSPVREGNNVAQTRLYIYDIANKSMAAASLPIDFKARVFTIVEVTFDGHVCLAESDPLANSPQQTSWFKVPSK